VAFLLNILYAMQLRDLMANFRWAWWCKLYVWGLLDLKEPCISYLVSPTINTKWLVNVGL
jgi:hypothetical protein